MTHYEAIKHMSQPQMTAVLYAMILPFMQDADEELKKEAWKDIDNLLKSEVESV